MAAKASNNSSILTRECSLLPSSAQSPAWSEVTRHSDGSFRVRLGGSFGQGWLASLCRGLADKRISIERAHAMRTRNLSWIAEFTALPLEGAADPDHVPYLALAVTPIELDGLPPKLVSYEVEPSFDGTLKLAFQAQDALGLLGTLLARLAGLGLYPVEMHIDTQTDIASDTLWLSTADGESPSPEMRTVLCGMLDFVTK
jgi:hypothetical protein